MPTNIANTQPSLVVTKAIVDSSSTVGAVRSFAFNFVPDGTRVSNGVLLPILQNTSLFSKIGTQYGGDGVATFALPDIRGDLIAGRLTSDLGVEDGRDVLVIDAAVAGQTVDNTETTIKMTYVINAFEMGAGTFDTVGFVWTYAGSVVPDWAVECNGQLLNIVNYPALYAAIGTTFGGNGVTTFAVPDLRDRALIGAGDGLAVGAVRGSEAGQLVDSGGTLVIADNHQPSLALTYLIATSGVFPSQGGSSSAPLGFQTLLGEIVAFAGTTVPTGFMKAEGQLLSISQNQALFSLLGTTYGGDGRTNFALPDLRGKAMVGRAPQAVTDQGGTAESAAFTIVVLGNDTDTEGGPQKILHVNGSAVLAGQQTTLPSGAIVTVNADGTIAYNPNGKFGYLVSTSKAAATGASNTAATDSFSYTLNGGSTANVSVTINGVDGVGDELRGTGGNNTITGTNTSDVIVVSQGGIDTASAGAGNDILFYGGSLTSEDRNDGGEGTDTLVLQGNYPALVLSATMMSNIEGMSLQSGSITRWGQSGSNSYDYNITFVDASVAPGLQFRANGQSLLSGEDLTFNGAAETDGGRFLIYAGYGTDRLTGGSGHDVFYFEAGRFNATDRITGGAGNDAVVISGAPSGVSTYALTIAAGTFSSIESLSFNGRFASDPTSRPSYEAILKNGNIAAGATLIVNGSSLEATQSLMFDAVAVTDGKLRIFGGAGGDTLKGGANADIIQGGAGADFLTGGGGADTFQYRATSESVYLTPSGSTTAGSDRILDFQAGVDKIDLSLIDADPNAPGDQAFAWIGSNAFSGTRGELHVSGGSGGWTILGDTTGDGVADFQIFVSATGITAADFFL